MNLYQLSSELRHILSQETDDGELPPDLADRLNAVWEELPARVESLCKWRAELIGEAEGVKLERKRLQALEDRLDRKADWVRKYILDSMQKIGLDKLKAGSFSASVCKSPPTATLLGVTPPQGYQKVTIELDKRQACQDWKDGVALPPEISVTQGFHVRIT